MCQVVNNTGSVASNEGIERACGKNVAEICAEEVERRGPGGATTRLSSSLRTPFGWRYLQKLNRKHSKSTFVTYNQDVYAGVFEELDLLFGPGASFLWNNLHWKIDKSEFLTRTKQWNDALHSFCSRQATWSEAHRREMIRAHTVDYFCTLWQSKL